MFVFGVLELDKRGLAGNLASHLVVREASGEEGDIMAERNGADGVDGGPLSALKEKKARQRKNKN